MQQFTNLQFLESKSFPFGCKPYTHPPGKTTNKHDHEFIELTYVCRGEAVHYYNNVSYPVSRGDVFIIPKGVAHYYRVSDRAPLHLYNIVFLKELLAVELKQMCEVSSFIDFFFLEPFLRETVSFESLLSLDDKKCTVMERIMNELDKESGEKELGYQIKIKAQLIDCLVFLSRCYKDQMEGRNPQIRSEEDRIRMICEFIERHISDNFTIDKLCSLCHMGKTKFCTQFKQYTGQTVVEFRNLRRIEQSKIMLQNTKLSIIGISQHTGFQDLSLFNRIFKRTTGVTPSQYRKAWDGGQLLPFIAVRNGD